MAVGSAQRWAPPNREIPGAKAFALPRETALGGADQNSISKREEREEHAEHDHRGGGDHPGR